MRILLGPSGSPAESTLEGIAAVAAMGLQAMELSFTHGVHMSLAAAAAVGKEAERCGIALSIHAPYYINLSSPEPAKAEASAQRVLATAERMQAMGGGPVVFHPGYYGKLTSERCFTIVKEQVLELMRACDKQKWDKVIIAPETTGRLAQFGTLEETLQLVQETGCGWCVDFCHLYARNKGHIDYAAVFDTIEKFGHMKAGRQLSAGPELHVQFSGVTWNAGGEKAHIPMGDHPPFEPLAKELLARKIGARIISESPLRWEDSLKQKAVFEKLGYRFDTR